MHALFRQASELTHDVISAAIEVQFLSVSSVRFCSKSHATNSQNAEVVPESFLREQEDYRERT
jgi:hypothetical protein